MELVQLDRLAHDELEALGDARHDPEVYGLLVPRAPGGARAKVLDRDTALLFLTMARPGRLPAYVGAALGAELGPAVARLVLDGVLEIEHAAAFVSGPAAAAALGAASPAAVAATDVAEGRITRLSLEALRYAAALVPLELATLAGRIYGYGRLPLSPRWARRLPTRAAAEAYLGVRTGSGAAVLVRRDWTAHAGGDDTWLSWGRPSAARGGRRTTHKLYVSPLPEALPEALAPVLEALGRSDASAWKVGAGAAGLLRPDKLVAYFPDLDALGEAADLLRGALDGVPAHGVPFTAEITADGLLSWGVDPPASERTPGLGGGESWRVWLAHRLASALVAARSAAGAPEPWRYALERIRLDGVDPRGWIPAATLWRDAHAPT